MLDDRIAMSAYHRALSVGGEECAEAVADHAKRYAANLRRVATLVADHQFRRAARLQRLIIGSYDAAVTCAARTLPPVENLWPTRLEMVAKEFDPYGCRLELVTVRSKAKTSGLGWRPIVSFGLFRRVLDCLCADLLEARLGTSDWNMLARGRGAEEANNFLREKMAAGCKWFVTADIKDFYLSVKPKKLVAAFGLPSSLLECCISLSSLTPVRISSISFYERLNGAVHLGLTQGSRSASMVASWLLGPVLEQFLPAGHFIVYLDDLLVCASSRADALMIEKALHERFLAHPFGPFRLKSTVLSAARGVDFLKYRTSMAGSGALHSRPSAKSFDRRSRRIADIAAEAQPGALEGEVYAYEEAWKNAFPAWDRNEISEACLLATQFDAVRAGLLRASKK